jgi:hypothetical protein
MSNAVDRAVGRGAYALDVFDTLPSEVRAVLRRAVFNFDPVQAAQLVAQYGPSGTASMIEAAEADIIARTAPRAVAEVPALR